MQCQLHGWCQIGYGQAIFLFLPRSHQACLEPCAGLRNNAVEFATRPSSDFEMCEKSFCDNYSKEKEELYSDPKMISQPSESGQSKLKPL